MKIDRKELLHMIDNEEYRGQENNKKFKPVYEFASKVKKALKLEADITQILDWMWEREIVLFDSLEDLIMWRDVEDLSVEELKERCMGLYLTPITEDMVGKTLADMEVGYNSIEKVDGIYVFIYI